MKNLVMNVVGGNIRLHGKVISQCIKGLSMWVGSISVVSVSQKLIMTVNLQLIYR